MRLMDWPNLKKTERERWHRQLYRLAYPAEESEAVTTEELANKLAALING